MLVKDTYKPKTSEAKVFVACVKNDTADMPYEIACSLMKPKDMLHVLCIYSSDLDVGGQVGKIREKYEADMEGRGLPNCAMTMQSDKPGVTVVDMINEFAIEKDADFVVVVPSADATTLSSNCEALIKQAKTNLVICKK